MRKKLILRILTFGYLPLLYFAVYLPFIVPILPGWTQIPQWITYPVILCYGLILAVSGAVSSQKAIFIQSISIGLLLELFVYTTSRWSLPPFQKAYEGKFISEAAPKVFLLAVIFAILAEMGFLIHVLACKINRKEPKEQRIQV